MRHGSILVLVVVKLQGAPPVSAALIAEHKQCLPACHFLKPAVMERMHCLC